MAFITDLLAALGERLPLLLVGCAEILLAALPHWQVLWGKVQHKPSGKGRGAEAIFLQEWKRQSEEVCILLRRRDRMPVYTAGNLREVLGVTLTRLREDAASLLAGLDDETGAQTALENLPGLGRGQAPGGRGGNAERPLGPLHRPPQPERQL